MEDTPARKENGDVSEEMVTKLTFGQKVTLKIVTLSSVFWKHNLRNTMFHLAEHLFMSYSINTDADQSVWFKPS